MPTVDEMLSGTPDPPPIPAVLFTAASRMPWRKLAQLSLSLPGHFVVANALEKVQKFFRRLRVHRAGGGGGHVGGLGSSAARARGRNTYVGPLVRTR
jgi:hypothetical protein